MFFFRRDVPPSVVVESLGDVARRDVHNQPHAADMVGNKPVDLVVADHQVGAVAPRRIHEVCDRFRTVFRDFNPHRRLE